MFFVVSLSAGMSEFTGSIPWYPFSPWQNSSELGFAHDLSKALLYVVLVVQVVFPISARRLSNDGQLFLKCLILIKCGCSCGMNTEKSVPLSERNKVLRLWQHWHCKLTTPPSWHIWKLYLKLFRVLRCRVRMRRWSMTQLPTSPMLRLWQLWKKLKEAQMLESFAWIVCKVLWLQWTKHERSVSFFLYSFLIKLTLQGYRQCKLSSLLYFVVSLAAGLSEHWLLYVVLVVQVVFPISARRLSNDLSKALL